ncbi:MULTISPECIES: hypothetical protein [Pantoea]|uniref:Uncharacterized protein n=1 Tax=Candidatus Pantoea multigeneris TaxID=2608357 RepID=A0ABX0R9T1_9GAMM|nr:MULTISPECIES: hypothetical protein [Pantoea]NIF22132.1 hypothetical protein [Pantoea multigeneris]
MSLNESYPLMRNLQRELEAFHQALSGQQKSLQEGFTLLRDLWCDEQHQATAVLLEECMAENDAYLKTDAPELDEHLAVKLRQIASYLRGQV